MLHNFLQGSNIICFPFPWKASNENSYEKLLEFLQLEEIFDNFYLELKLAEQWDIEPEENSEEHF